MSEAGRPLPLKTRALRKYEAEPLVVATEAGRPPLDLLSPFGPLIGRMRVPRDLVNRVNAFAEGQVDPAIGREFLVPQEIAAQGGNASLVTQLGAYIRRYVEQAERAAVTRLRIDVIWVVSQYAGTPSPVHFHSGDISGVLYLGTPEIEDEEAEAAKTYISGRQAGYINFLSGGKQRFARSLISFRPEVGDLYLFPGWLLHGAEPFNGRGERRSLSFNAWVEVAE